MSTIVTRSGKGSPLSHVEVDANFTNLNTDKAEKANNLSDLTSASTARTNLGLVIGTDVLSPSGSGASLTSLNATNISSGTLAAARLPALVGDASSSAGSSTLTLATVNSNTGSFGSTTSVPVITVNGKGLITAVSTATVSGSISVTGGDLTLSGNTGTAITNATLATVNSNTGSFGSATSIPVVTVNGKGLVTAVSTATVQGGAALSNDTTTASNLYPLFAAATTGTPTTIYTSNAKYLYKPSTGDLSASQVIASNGLVLNNATVSSSYTVATGNNAMSVGPMTIASGQSVTVSSGQRWVVL
jgi:flagellar biogenesis protein FliO